MSYRRFAARRGRQDANASAIITALKRCGASVVDLHAVGGGCPDILVGFRSAPIAMINGGQWIDNGNMVLMEIKISAKPSSNPSVRARQEAFARDWRGTPVVTVHSEAEALAAIGIRLNE